MHTYIRNALLYRHLITQTHIAACSYFTRSPTQHSLNCATL